MRFMQILFFLIFLFAFVSIPKATAATLGTTTTDNANGINLIDTNYCRLLSNSSSINITSIHAYNSYGSPDASNTTGFAIYEDNGSGYNRIYLTSGVPVVSGWNAQNVDLNADKNILACIGQSSGTPGFILARSSNLSSTIFLPHGAGYSEFTQTFPYNYVGNSNDPSIYITYSTRTPTPTLTPTPTPLATWDIVQDFRIVPNQENPSRDSYGNPGVWSYLESSSLVHNPSTYSLLTNFITDAFYIQGLQEWHGNTVYDPKNILSRVGINTTGTMQQAYSISWLTDIINAHPNTGQMVIVAWKSPVDGSVKISGGVIDLDNNCGNGIKWFIDKDSVNIAQGQFSDGGSQNFSNGTNGSNLINISVSHGQFLYFIVDPNGEFGCDSTGITATISLITSTTPTPTPANASPTVGTLTASVNPVQVGTRTDVSVNFTDSNTSDTHTAIFDWGDGMTSTGVITESNGSGSVTGSHIYLAAGVYEVALIVEDNHGAADSEVFRYLSVYNPTPQGLFTGVRIFQSPLGAVSGQPTVTGQVKFGVTAKYQGTAINGDVSMGFNAANIEFNSTTLDVLVTSNGKATLRGTGTLNNNPGYTFLVTGLDGGSGGDDFIRFQIKNNSNNIVYDSQPQAVDTTDPTTLVTAGQVIVH